MLESLFNRINQEVDKRAEAREKQEGHLVQTPPITELSSADVHGPLEDMPETLIKTARPEEVGLEDYVEPDEAITLKTDATVAHEKQALIEKVPTIRTEETVALKASEAQTFKTGETIAQEEALVKAKTDFYKSEIASSKETIRDLDKGYMEYDAIHSRVTQWLEKLDQMLAQPSPLAELVELKDRAMKAKMQIEGQLDIEQYGIAKSEQGAASFKVEVPAEWPQLEARLNEIAEAAKAGHTLRDQLPSHIEERPQSPEAMS